MFKSLCFPIWYHCYFAAPSPNCPTLLFSYSTMMFVEPDIISDILREVMFRRSNGIWYIKNIVYKLHSSQQLGKAGSTSSIISTCYCRWGNWGTVIRLLVQSQTVNKRQGLEPNPCSPKSNVLSNYIKLLYRFEIILLLLFKLMFKLHIYHIFSFQCMFKPVFSIFSIFIFKLQHSTFNS